MPVIIDTPVIPTQDPWTRRETNTGPSEVELRSNASFLGTVLGQPKRTHFVSRDKLNAVVGTRYGTATVSLGVQAIHQAFDGHVALELRPETLWYIIVHEVAEFVRQNADACAHLFTEAPGTRQMIEVIDNTLLYDGPCNWTAAINRFRDPLREKITDRTMELFLPNFTTSTDESDTALLVALMDVASPYYEFKMTTRCGIPQIRLEGDPSDWTKLRTSAESLLKQFPGLYGYADQLLIILQEIADTANGSTPNEEFWRSIYKYLDSSGGPYVNGWITSFFAFIITRDGAVPKSNFAWKDLVKSGGGFKANSFPSHISRVPFVWDYYGRMIDMALVTGITGVDFDNGFLSPKLGYAVVEI